MSIPVLLPDLPSVLARYRFAYLMTNASDGPPHVIAVMVRPQGSELIVDGGGRRTRANLAARPAVGLVWPPMTEDGHSLIVDGHATVEGDLIRILPSRAVLHRPAAGRQAGGSAPNCEPGSA